MKLHTAKSKQKQFDHINTESSSWKIPNNCNISDIHRQYIGRVPRGSVVECLTRNPGVLSLSRTGSSVFFSWECPWARHFRALPSTGETQKSMNNVSCRRDMTEILLKAA